MTEEMWGWLLFGAEVVGLGAMGVLVGRHRLWWGWLIVAGFVSMPWLIYSVTTTRYGFLALSLTWLTVHLSNAHQWRRDQIALDPDPSDTSDRGISSGMI